MHPRETRSRVYRIARGLLVATVAIVVAGIAAITVVRTIHLPATSCTVTLAAAEAAPLERPYAAVRDALGCDGVMVARTDFGHTLRIETYRWRGDAWPFGWVDGRFYNGIMHGRDVRWVALRLGWNAETSKRETGSHTTRAREATP
jgi:hypothetical protein